MDSWELYQYLSDICPPVEIVEGSVFLNRYNLPREKIIENIKEYGSILEAQKWINMVPVDDFLSNIVDNWNINDNNIMLIMSIYARSWLMTCSNAGINDDVLHVSCLKDHETGDVIFRLEQKYLAIPDTVNVA